MLKPMPESLVCKIEPVTNTAPLRPPSGFGRRGSDAPDPLAQLHEFARSAIAPSLREAIRLLASEEFDELTEAQILEVANYRSIELREEVFFERAFTPGKEAAAALALARRHGRDLVLDDLRRLQASLGGEC